jgi:hypothetical protein
MVLKSLSSNGDVRLSTNDDAKIFVIADDSTEVQHSAGRGVNLRDVICQTAQPNSSESVKRFVLHMNVVNKFDRAAKR